MKSNHYMFVNSVKAAKRTIQLTLTVFFVLLCLSNAALAERQQSTPSIKKYQCPPCGCDLDNKVLNEKGYCQSCNMKLYEVLGDNQKIISITAPLLEDTTSKFYSKFVYPAFIIGILLGLISLINFNGKSFNPFLGGLILVLAMYGFKHQIYGVSYGFTNNYRWLFLPISWIMLLGPLVHFYVNSLLGTLVSFKKQMIHAVPFFIVFCMYLVLLIAPDGTKQKFMDTPFEIVFGHLEQLFSIVICLIYLIFSYSLFRNWLENQRAGDIAKWLNKFFIGTLILIVSWLVHIIINYSIYDMGVATLTYNPLWVTISMFIYWILIEVMINPKLYFNYPNLSYSKLSDQEFLSGKSKLVQLMEQQKPYLDPQLNLNKLASMLDMNPKTLSAILNTGFNKNFYEFINTYRIDEVKKLLVDPDFKHLTIAAIANEAGFNSKSSFNAIFKKFTNKTPKEYLKLQG